MKKYLIFILFCFLVLPIFVKAESCDVGNITIEEIGIEDIKGEVNEKNPPVIDGLSVKLDLKFTEVNDYIKYRINIKNNTDDVFEFDKENIVSDSDYISYTFENGNSIEAHETKDIFLIIKYKTKVDSTSFENGVFNENKSIKSILNLGEIINPKTGMYDINIILFIVFMVSFVIFLIVNKKVSKQLYGILLLIGFIIPIKIYSACLLEIEVVSDIEIQQYKDRDIYNILTDDSMLDKDKSKYVTSEGGIDFKNPSSDTNGKGLYIFTSTKDDKYPVYYYRGDVNNNNVLFGGFCWKILRTTSTGGTKLVYNGIPDSENKCNNTEENTMIATGVKYSTSGSISHFGYAYDTGHTYKNVKISNIANGSVFAEDVSFVDGKYVLNDERYIKDSNLESTIDESLSNHHYSCFKDENGECTTINYIYMNRGAYLYYVVLSDGEKINDALEKDLKSTNATDSTVKANIENWYANNLTSYSNFLEDEVWCNDRSIGSLGGWDKHGAISESSDPALNDINKLRLAPLMRAKEGKPSLECVNQSDRFMMNDTEGNGKSTYPIGLITLDEALLAGFAWDKDDYSSYLYNGKLWWSMSPTLNSVQLGYIGVLHSMADNVHTGYISNGTGGVRPLVSLNKRVKIIGGNGTSDNPFTVEYFEEAE